jgi:hypothetical protein
VGVSVQSGAPERNSVRGIASEECEALDSLRSTYFGSFFLDPRVSRVEVWELSGTLAREQDFLDLISD